MKNLKTFDEFVNESRKSNSIRYFKYKEKLKSEKDARKHSKKKSKEEETPEDLELRADAMMQKEGVTESFDEPGYTPHKLKNSRLVMKTRDDLYYMQRHQLEKLLDQVNKVKHKLEDKYNKEQEGHNRFSVTDSLSADLTYLRSYAKIINYFLN